MPNRRRFICQTAAVLMACSLSSLRTSPFKAFLQQGPARDSKQYGNQNDYPASSVLYVGGLNASDSNPGTASAPFATIQAAANVAKAGNVVRIRDGIYRETVRPANSGTDASPILFEADTRPDGSMCEPVINGADLVTTNWTLASHPNLPGVNATTKPIYQTKITLPVSGYPNMEGYDNVPGYLEPLANQLFMSSKMMPEARWPKVADTDDPMNPNNFRQVVGNRAPDKATSRWGIDWSNLDNPLLNDPQMPRIPGGWSGGYIKLYVDWLTTSCKINYSGSDGIRWQHEDPYWTGPNLRKIDLEDYRWNAALRYHLFGKIGALTAPGEWFYENGTLYFWSPDGGVPKNVEYKSRALGFDLTGRRCITIKGLNFFACEIHDNGGSIFPTGWGVPNPHRGGISHAPNDRIVIDLCRFKYQNHVDTLPNTGPHNHGGVPDKKFTFWWEMVENRFPGANIHWSRVPQCGIRLTGDNSVVRNCVMRVAASSAVGLYGRNSLAENNYISHIGYCGSYSPGIVLQGLAYGSKALRNTVHDVCRSAIVPNGQHQEVGYNDLYNHGKLNSDGGCIYIHHIWNASYAREVTKGAAIQPKVFGADYDGSADREAYGTRIHHNWIHDYLHFGRGWVETRCSGTYYDSDVDGIITDHNVYWNNFVDDAWSHQLDDRRQLAEGNVNLAKFNRFYNNTFGSGPAPSRDCINLMGGTVDIYNLPGIIENNLYCHTQGADRDVTGLRYPLKPSEVRYITQDMINSRACFTDAAHVVPQDPGLVSYKLSKATSGLDFLLRKDSIARNRGVKIDGTRDNLGIPITGVDDYDGPAPDSGAYEYGRKPWIPGCDLPDEFITGEPWKRQWQ